MSAGATGCTADDAPLTGVPHWTLVLGALVLDLTHLRRARQALPGARARPRASRCRVTGPQVNGHQLAPG